MKSSTTYYTSSFPQPLINHYPCKLFNDLENLVQSSSASKICEICQREEKLFLLSCITCQVTVHSHCYQLETFQDPWQCQPCLNRSLGLPISPCRVCSQSTGALRQYPKGWYHIICRTWPSHKMLIEGKCGLCSLTTGKFVNCEVCWGSFHPYCGFLNGLKYLNQRMSCDEHLDFKEQSTDSFFNDKEKLEIRIEDLKEPRKKRKIEEKVKKEEKKERIDEKLAKNDGNVEKLMKIDESLVNSIEKVGKSQEKVGKNEVKKGIKDEKRGKGEEKKGKNEENKGKNEENKGKIVGKNKKFNGKSEDVGKKALDRGEGEIVNLNQNIAKLMKIKPKGTVEEVCIRFEDYLFSNSRVVVEGYELTKNLQKVLGIDKILFCDVKETLLRFCT